MIREKTLFEMVRNDLFDSYTPAKIPFSVALGRSAASALALSGL
jgi:hypothetical protein